MQSFLKRLTLTKLLIISLIVFIFLGVYIRSQGLGYSEFQGDEIDTVEFVPNVYGTTPSFKTFFTKSIFENKKGPVQYTINFLNLKTFPSVNEFRVRFPYLVFSLLSFVLFYFLSKNIFESKISALATVTVLATNGLFVAFSRITQYQAFMFLLQPLTVYLFLLGYYKKSTKLLFFSAVVFGLAFLTHYDALVLFSFFYSFLFLEYIKDRAKLRQLLKYGLVFTFIFSLISVPFYFMYLRGDYYENTTSSYLSRRLLGFGLMPRVPVVLNMIIHLYMPKLFWLLFLLITATGLLPWYKKFTDLKFLNFKFSKKIVALVYVFGVALFSLSVVFSNYPIKPRASTLLVYLASLIILACLVVFSKKFKSEIISLITWFLFSFNVYFFFIKDPRTHVYISMLPAFLLAGYGISVLWGLYKSRMYKINMLTLFFIGFGYLTLFNWQVFVNKNPEYPWFQKTLFGNNMYVTPHEYYKKVEGVFGFNYYRHWREVSALFKNGCLVGDYNSNEKDSVTQFYIGKSQNDVSKRGLVLGAPNLITIEGPHSWVYTSPDEQPETSYIPLKSFYNNSILVMQVWGDKNTYSNGDLLCE